MGRRTKPRIEGTYYVVEAATQKPRGSAFMTEKGAWSKADHLSAVTGRRYVVARVVRKSP